MSLHIREKKNKSGSVSVIIVDRNNRGYKVVETIGCAYNETDLKIFLDIAQTRLKKLNKKLYPTLLDATDSEHSEHKNLPFINIYNRDMIPIGDELIYGELFKQIGCNKIFAKDREYKLFKVLVISRLLYPGSKLYTIDYIEYFKKEKIDKNKIYRFLDTLYTPEIKSNIERCVFTHTKKIMDDAITVTFYDVTTLYFESEGEDDLR